MLRHTITQYEEVVMLGKVFKQGGINCVYGPSGVGKTISSVKALNSEDITPILLDFDGNGDPDILELKYIHLEGKSVIASFIAGDIIYPENEVIIIDTWALFSSYTDHLLMLEEMSKKNTLIVIAHSKDYAGRDNIPDVEPELINHWSAKLFLSYDKGSSVKSNPRAPGYNLEIMKLRNYKGDRVIANWMRE